MSHFSDRYYPQISKQTLIGQINQNYQAASNYYSQRQKNFQRVLKKQAGLTLTSFETQINQMITNLWEKNIYKVLENIYLDTNYTIKQKEQMIRATFNTSNFIEDYIQAIKSSNYNLFKGRMGNIFEHFIDEQIFQPYIKTATTFAQGHLNTLVSGAFTSKSSVTKKVASIRPDLLISLSDITFEKDNSVLYGSTNQLPLELQRTLTINWDQAFPSFQNEMESSDGSILKAFLKDSSFFGFSAKIYNSFDDNKRFSNSSVIQQELNKVFWYPNNKKNSPERHSWEPDYTETYVIWNLSRLLRTIISPTNIAIIYGDKMEWMSNFLQNKIFYMNISASETIQNHNAGNGRVFPSIANSQILTKNFNIGKGISALNTTIAYMKYYKGIELSLT